MKKTFQQLCILGLFLLTGYTVKAQVVSYQLDRSYTVAQLDSLFASTGFNLPVSPQYPVEVYQVIYKTPYIQVNNLKNASGIIVVPRNTACPPALISYHHGTSSKREGVPSYGGAEQILAMFFAGIGGVCAVIPDELGLGKSDSSILIHPYMNAFHSGFASINLLRAARQLQDSLQYQLSGEVGFTGYSQGGYTTVAAHKLIQDSFPTEFNIIGSAPMSGAYDLNNTMINDVMLSDSAYSTPSYLPFLLLGYHSVYPSLQQIYPTPSDIFKSPYDTLLPPLFYSKEYSTSYINGLCNPVPKLMIKDSVLNDFIQNPNHIFRTILRENDMLGWAPAAPVKLHYCTADEQVYYMNSIRADSAWRANGATQVEIQNFGNLTHGGCVQPAISSGAFYLLGKVSACTGIRSNDQITFNHYPNPASDKVMIVKEDGACTIQLFALNGTKVISGKFNEATITLDVHHLPRGMYTLSIQDLNGKTSFRKLILQ